LPVYVAEDPLSCVVRGSGISLDYIEKYPSLFTYE
jgi:rod shape-determining protein MreB